MDPRVYRTNGIKLSDYFAPEYVHTIKCSENTLIEDFEVLRLPREKWLEMHQRKFPQPRNRPIRDHPEDIITVTQLIQYIGFGYESPVLLGRSDFANNPIAQKILDWGSTNEPRILSTWERQLPWDWRAGVDKYLRIEMEDKETGDRFMLVGNTGVDEVLEYGWIAGTPDALYFYKRFDEYGNERQHCYVRDPLVRIVEIKSPFPVAPFTHPGSTSISEKAITGWNHKGSGELVHYGEFYEYVDDRYVSCFGSPSETLLSCAQRFATKGTKVFSHVLQTKYYDSLLRDLHFGVKKRNQCRDGYDPISFYDAEYCLVYGFVDNVNDRIAFVERWFQRRRYEPSLITGAMNGHMLFIDPCGINCKYCLKEYYQQFRYCETKEDACALRGLRWRLDEQDVIKTCRQENISIPTARSWKKAFAAHLISANNWSEKKVDPKFCLQFGISPSELSYLTSGHGGFFWEFIGKAQALPLTQLVTDTKERQSTNEEECLDLQMEPNVLQLQSRLLVGNKMETSLEQQELSQQPPQTELLPKEYQVQPLKEN